MSKHTLEPIAVTGIENKVDALASELKRKRGTRTLEKSPIRTI